MTSRKFEKHSELSGSEGSMHSGGEEEEKLEGEELDNEEEQETEAQEEQQEKQEAADKTEKKMGSYNKKIADAINGELSSAQLKTKSLVVTFDSSLTEMRKSEMDPVSVPLGENFKEADGSFHIGQVKKITCVSATSTMPCSVGVTITGDKIPAPAVEMAGAPHMKGHLILFPKQSKLHQKKVVLFEQKLLTENKAVSADNEAFSKEYIGVSKTNAHLLGTTDHGKVVLCTENAPVLKWYLSHRIKSYGGSTTPKKLKSEGATNDTVCYWDKNLGTFVMDKKVFQASLKTLVNRLDFGTSVSFENLAVQLDRVKLSAGSKGNPWTDTEEVKHYATEKQMGDWMKLPQKCYLTLRIEYL